VEIAAALGLREARLTALEGSGRRWRWRVTRFSTTGMSAGRGAREFEPRDRFESRERDTNMDGLRVVGGDATGLDGAGGKAGRDGVGRDALGRFAACNSGRPFGMRNRVSARVARAILADFEENQVELLVRMRRWFPPQYAAMVSRLLPRNGSERDGEGEAALAGGVTLADVRAVLDRLEAAGGSLADLEAVIANAGSDGAGTDIIGR
jgi:hypothetical protein